MTELRASANTAVQYCAVFGVARITLAEPTGRNPLDAAVLTAIAAGLKQAEADAAIRAVVIDSKGEHFCSGLDLSIAALDGIDVGIDSLRLFADILLHLRRSPLPVIACVDGRASGGGVGLAAACDIVLADAGASFVLPEVVLGMIPAVIAPILLRRITPGRLTSLSLSSRTISAIEAKEIGIVDEVAEGTSRVALERQLVRIGRSSPDAIATAKRMIDDAEGGDLEHRLDTACMLQAARLQRPDVCEGVRTFAEGLSPPWFSRIGAPARGGHK